mgnify:CR=1 FL=1
MSGMIQRTKTKRPRRHVRRTWWVAEYACECGSSGRLARSRDPEKNARGPRCPVCRRILERAEWNPERCVLAVSAAGALAIAARRRTDATCRRLTREATGAKVRRDNEPRSPTVKTTVPGYASRGPEGGTP